LAGSLDHDGRQISDFQIPGSGAIRSAFGRSPNDSYHWWRNGDGNAQRKQNRPNKTACTGEIALAATFL